MLRILISNFSHITLEVCTHQICCPSMLFLSGTPQNSWVSEVLPCVCRTKKYICKCHLWNNWFTTSIYIEASAQWPELVKQIDSLMHKHDQNTSSEAIGSMCNLQELWANYMKVQTQEGNFHSHSYASFHAFSFTYTKCPKWWQVWKITLWHSESFFLFIVS